MTKPKIPNDGRLLADDWMLDLSHQAMLDLARVCRQRYGRKPTLEDFRRLLAVRLAVSAEDYFADGKSLEVTEVIFKTKKRPRAQRYKPGDVFAIPLAADLYAFGRIMRDTRGQLLSGALVEIFRETSSNMSLQPSIVDSGRLFFPTSINPLECFKNRRWVVIASDDTYRLSEEDRELEFTFPDPHRDGWLAIKGLIRGTPSRTLSDDEGRRMEADGHSGGMGRVEDLEDRIRVALGMALG